MSYTVQNAKNELLGMMHGTTLDDIINIDGVFDRAARQLLMDVDPQETIRSSYIPFYDKLYTFPLAADVKGNKIIDVQHLHDRGGRIYPQNYSQEFSIKQQQQNARSLNISFRNGLKYLSLKAFELPQAITIAETSNATDWSAVLAMTGLSDTDTNTVTGDGSLYYNYNGANLSATMSTTVDALDLSDLEDRNAGVFLLNTSVPVGASLASMTLKIGSGAGDYITITSTSTHQGTVFQNAWNAVSFLLANGTETGTIDWSAITIAEVTWTFTSTTPQTGIYLDGLFFSKGEYLEYLYYSKFLFRNTAGVFQETVDDDTNIINLDTETYNLYLYQVALLASQEQQSANTGFDANFFAQKYKDCLDRYKNMYKAEVQTPQSTYYKIQRGGYPQTSRRFKR